MLFFSVSISVSLKNWDEAWAGLEGLPCTFGEGSTADKVLFYDVRDPERPRYWGAITADELGVSEISSLGLAKTPDNLYFLYAGGDGSYATWVTKQITPNIEGWSRTNTTAALSGQHGMTFGSVLIKMNRPLNPHILRLSKRK